MAIPKENIIKLKGDLKISNGQIQEATNELQKQQSFYNNDGNYVE